jgi:hypothetical protein
VDDIPGLPLALGLILSLSEHLGRRSEMHLRDGAESVPAAFDDDSSGRRFDRG